MNFPGEYRWRMLAEQMAIVDALQFIAQILICFYLLVICLILIVNLSELLLKTFRCSPTPRLILWIRRLANHLSQTTLVTNWRSVWKGKLR
jgi:hypothetical protein